jgi:hypothetical protein
VREWCGRPGAHVVVRPVLDLTAHAGVDAYEVPATMAERVRLRAPTPLCRFHHRLKTHGGWIYTRLDETSLLWRSPHGLRFLRDHTGTRDVTDGSLIEPPDR